MKQPLLLSFTLLLLTSTWAFGSQEGNQQQERKQTPMQQNERQRLEEDYVETDEAMDVEEGEQAEPVINKIVVAGKKIENPAVYIGEPAVVSGTESAISFNFVYYIIQRFKLSELVSE